MQLFSPRVTALPLLFFLFLLSVSVWWLHQNGHDGNISVSRCAWGSGFVHFGTKLMEHSGSDAQRTWLATYFFVYVLSPSCLWPVKGIMASLPLTELTGLTWSRTTELFLPSWLSNSFQLFSLSLSLSLKTCLLWTEISFLMDFFNVLPAEIDFFPLISTFCSCSPLQALSRVTPRGSTSWRGCWTLSSRFVTDAWCSSS